MTQRRVGRNDACPCGSGKKNKRCHNVRYWPPREEVAPAGSTFSTPQDVIDVFRVLDKGYCMHPHAHGDTCSGTIVRAHSMSRAGSLERIAREHRVYGVPLHIGEWLRNGDWPGFRLLPCARASTFSGFCSFHDDQLFKPIESADPEFSAKHAFLLSYRTICRELFAKRLQRKKIPLLRGTANSEPLQRAVETDMAVDAYTRGVDAGLRDLEDYKSSLDRCLESDDWSRIRFLGFAFDSVPQVLFAGAILPEFDFDGNQVQSLNDPTARLDSITASVIATSSGGAAFVMWTDGHSAAESFAKSLWSLDDACIPSALVRLGFEHFENLFIAPDWWDRLEPILRQSLVWKAQSGMSLYSPREPTCLVGRIIPQVTWSLRSRRCNRSWDGVLSSS